MLSPNELQLRDSIIIGLGTDEKIRNGKEPLGIAAHLCKQQIALTEPLENRRIDAPMVLLEGDRQSHGIEDYYVDPPTLGNSIPLGLYLAKWAGFARLLLSLKMVVNVRQADYVYALLQRSVDQCRRTRGVASARALVQALHDTRWSIGPEMTAELFTVATLDPSTRASCPSLSDDHAFLMTEISAVRMQLGLVKDACQNLTEWCEALYLINPRVWALLGYLRESDLPEAEKWYRYFAEVDADITPCSMRNVFSAIQLETGESGASWESLFLNERAESTDQKEFKQKLQSLLYSRTCIPKFWFDMALQSYEVAKESLPAALNSVDVWRAISTDVLRASSMAWLAGLRP